MNQVEHVLRNVAAQGAMSLAGLVKMTDLSQGEILSQVVTAGCRLRVTRCTHPRYGPTAGRGSIWGARYHTTLQGHWVLEKK